MHEAGGAARAFPPDALSCMTEVTLEGTQELMRSRDTGRDPGHGRDRPRARRLLLGQARLRRGPGQRARLHREDGRRDEGRRATSSTGKTFDYGTLCSSEQSIVCDEAIRDQVVAEVEANGGYFLSEAEAAAVARVVVTPQRLANPEIVGKPAPYIAREGRDQGPAGDARARGSPRRRGPRLPALDREALPGARLLRGEGLATRARERCLELLRFGGTGHTMGIHSRDDAVIREFALREARVPDRSPTPRPRWAPPGYTTGLAPSMSLGCGAYAGNITSDNITPLHLINVKRLAYELRAPARTPAAEVCGRGRRVRRQSRRLLRGSPAGPKPVTGAPGSSEAPLDFVCEDDVRRALREGRILRVSARAIVTPPARDLRRGHERARGRRQTIRPDDAVLSSRSTCSVRGGAFGLCVGAARGA